MGDKISMLLATFFYVGRAPIAPGTVASALAVLIYIVFFNQPVLFFCLFLFITIIGFQVSSDAERILKQKDPSCVVIDEVSGMMIGCLFLPLNMSVLLAAFLIFRVIDILKLYPLNVLEKIEGGEGIMFDDIVGGVYTCIIMQIALKFI